MTLRLTKNKNRQDGEGRGGERSIPKPRILLRYLLISLGFIYIWSNFYLTKTHSSSFQSNNQNDKRPKNQQQDSLWYNFLQNFTNTADTSVATTSTTTAATTTLNDNDSNNTTVTTTAAINNNNNDEKRLPRILVIYFPQFHPDPLNDKNWGVNFTDWVSLQGSPKLNRFGYEIPRPTELGYYDLRETSIRQKQGQLARQYGIDGFIYHTYWFYDTTHPGPNLAAPLLNMLQDGQPDMPFMFNWCISRWTNVWMGKAIFQKIPTSMNRMLILQEQYFNATNDMIHDHYKWLAQFFHNRNYIKINNKPAYLIYYYDERVLPIMDKLNDFAKQDGFPDGIHWIVGRSAAPNDIYVPQGLDERLTKIMSKKTQHLRLIQTDKFDQSMTYPYALEYVTREYEIPDWCRHHYYHDRDDKHNIHFNGTSSSSPPPPTPTLNSINKSNHPEITGIMTSFDNTPRRQYDSAYVYRPDIPEKIIERFHNNLYVAMYYHKCCFIGEQTEEENHNGGSDDDDHFVTINAWNEWAEGMSIEPSNVYGRGYLEAIQNVKQQLQKVGCSSSLVPKFEFTNSTR